MLVQRKKNSTGAVHPYPQQENVNNTTEVLVLELYIGMPMLWVRVGRLSLI